MNISQRLRSLPNSSFDYLESHYSCKKNQIIFFRHCLPLAVISRVFYCHSTIQLVSMVQHITVQQIQHSNRYMTINTQDYDKIDQTKTRGRGRDGILFYSTHITSKSNHITYHKFNAVSHEISFLSCLLINLAFCVHELQLSSSCTI